MVGILAWLAGSVAFGCVVGPMVPLGTVPADGGEIPFDGRFLVLAGEGIGDESSFVPVVFHEGRLIEGGGQIWCGAGPIPDVTDCVYVFRPEEPLVVGDPYTIELREGGFGGDAVLGATVTAVDRPASRSDVAPELVVRSSDPIASPTDCDLDPGFQVVLDVTADSPDPDGLSYTRIYRQVEGADPEHVAVAVFPAGSAGPVEVSFQTVDVGCFEAEHIDGTGQISPPSEPVCFGELAEGGDQVENPSVEDEVALEEPGGCGCTSSPPTNTGWLPGGLLAAGGAARMRRRRRQVGGSTLR